MKSVSEWLGHCDIHTTMNIYAHVSNETKQSMANNLGALLSNDLPPKEPAVERKVEKLIHFPAV